MGQGVKPVDNPKNKGKPKGNKKRRIEGENKKFCPNTLKRKIRPSQWVG